MAFLYPFINFLQPGILWPELASWRPMLLLSGLAFLTAVMRARKGAYSPFQHFTHGAFLWLLTYVAIQIFSVYYSGVSSMISEFVAWYIFPLQVAISLLLLRSAAALRQFIWGTLLGGAAVVGHGLFTFLTRPAALSGRPVGAYGMYENHNDYTFMALTLLPFAWMLIRDQKRWLPKFALYLLSASCIAGVLVSLSRGGAIVLALEVAFLTWVSTRGVRRTLLMSGFLALAPVVVVYQFAARDAGRTNDYTVETAKSSRFELWTAAGRMIAKHPLLGVGSHRFQEYSNDYNEISHDNRGKNSHNTYLEVAAGSGLLGLFSYVAMLSLALVPLTRAWRSMGTSDPLSTIRTATFIASVSIVIRAFLDVKLFDPCIYMLLTIAIAVLALSDAQGDAAPVAAPAGASRTVARRRSSSSVYPAGRTGLM
jgi:O-antigen ligase